MNTGALVSTTALRIPRPRPGVGHFGHFGHFSFGHIGSFLVHMAIWHMMSRLFMRVPGLVGLILVVAFVVFLTRWWSRRRVSRGGWARPRRW